MSSITLNAAVVGWQRFGLLQAADGKIDGMSSAASGTSVSGTCLGMDAGLAPPPARIINGLCAKFNELIANFIRLTVPARIN